MHSVFKLLTGSYVYLAAGVGAGDVRTGGAANQAAYRLSAADIAVKLAIAHLGQTVTVGDAQQQAAHFMDPLTSPSGCALDYIAGTGAQSTHLVSAGDNMSPGLSGFYRLCS